MSITTLVRRMADAGASPELIAIAVEEIEALQLSLDARRAADRDRKRLQREREKRANVTGQSGDSHGTVQDSPSPQSPPLKAPPDPQKITPPLTPHPIANGARPKFAAPDGVQADQWKAFRQQRKKALNERSYALLCNKLRDLADAGWPPGKMIDLAIERGWETVFEPKDQGNARQGGSNREGGQHMGRPGSNPTLQLLRSANAAIARDREDRSEPWPAVSATKHQ